MVSTSVLSHNGILSLSSFRCARIASNVLEIVEWCFMAWMIGAIWSLMVLRNYWCFSMGEGLDLCDELWEHAIASSTCVIADRKYLMQHLHRQGSDKWNMHNILFPKQRVMFLRKCIGDYISCLSRIIDSELIITAVHPASGLQTNLNLPEISSAFF